MRYLALASALLGLMATSASAERVEFRGKFTIISVNAPCTAEGWSEGGFVNFRYNPSGVADNGPSSRFSIIFDFSSQNYTLPAGTLVGSTFKPVDGTGLGRGAYTFDASMRISAQVPANPTAATPFINLTGIIRGFDGTANCVVGFRATGLPNVTD